MTPGEFFFSFDFANWNDDQFISVCSAGTLLPLEEYHSTTTAMTDIFKLDYIVENKIFLKYLHVIMMASNGVRFAELRKEVRWSSVH